MQDLARRLAFDPAAGTVVREPSGAGYGYWAGGHKVFHDAASGAFVLFYRERSPLERGRGAVCHVAVGDDGEAFRDVWSATKDELAATSIEVGHCLRHADAEWRLYLSYEVAATGNWRIDVLRGPSPDSLDTQGRRTVLSPRDFGLAWIKDPWLVPTTRGYHLYAAAPSRTGPRAHRGVIHAAPLDATVRAPSADGLYFPEIEYVFEASGAGTWDGRRARLNSIVPWPGGWLATFDGGRTSYDNYEEWCGLAWSDDGDTFRRIDTGGPWLRSPHGSVRYVQAVAVDDRLLFYYEYTRPDLSHDLRVASVPL